MSLAVAGVALLVAALGAARLASPTVDRWSEGKELMFGSMVVVVIAISFLTAITLARARPTPS
jgi:high-affinity nickel-transport protein